MLEMGTSGLMSGDGNRGGASASVPAPILDSTPLGPVKRPAGGRPQAEGLPHLCGLGLY